MADPFLDSLIPDSATQDWDGVVKLLGRGFDPKDYVFFDGLGPRVEYVNDGVLKIHLTKENTATAGAKEVKVHDMGNGGLSNTRTFTVTPK